MQSKHIKILHIVHSLNEGGIERLLLEICKKIDKDKFEIQICCLVEKGIIVSEFESAGIKIHFVNAERYFTFKNIFINIISLFKIIKIINKESISIVHGHEFYSTIFSRISSLFTGVYKNYITLHNIYYWWGNNVHRIQKLLSIITTKIICNSVSTMNYSIARDKIQKDKYELIYNGIDCDKFYPSSVNTKNILKELNISDDKKIFMSVGSISHRKGYEYLINAFSNVSKDFPEMILIIVGDKHYNEEEYYDKIINLISELNIKDKVIITGNRNDINQILNLCSIFIMSSVAEGFGLALAEAMATEKVCIASDISPFKELITDNLDGYLFRSEDIHSLQRTIIKVLVSNEEELKRIGILARKKIITNFNSDKMIFEYERLYSS